MMKRLKTTGILLVISLLLVFTAVSVTACGKTVVAESVAITGKPTDNKVVLGQNNNEFQLGATVTPADAADATVEWSSATVATATVNASGKVTVKSKGTTIITASVKGNADIKDSFTLAVSEQPVAPSKTITAIAFTNAPSGNVTLGTAPLKLAYSSTPTDADTFTVAWNSTVPAVATVVDGLLTYVSDGASKITATVIGTEIKAEFDLTVVKPILTAINLSADTTEMIIGGKIDIKYALVPTLAVIDPLWESDTTDVLTVDSGMVTAIALGEAFITLKDKTTNVSDTIKVTVRSNAITAITIAPAAGGGSLNELILGSPKSYGYTTIPATPDTFAVNWSSDAPTIATVDQNGLVTPLKEGSVTITVSVTGTEIKDTHTAKVVDGYTDYFENTVIADSNYPNQINGVYFYNSNPDGGNVEIVDSFLENGGKAIKYSMADPKGYPGLDIMPLFGATFHQDRKYTVTFDYNNLSKFELYYSDKSGSFKICNANTSGNAELQISIRPAMENVGVRILEIMSPYANTPDITGGVSFIIDNLRIRENSDFLFTGLPEDKIPQINEGATTKLEYQLFGDLADADKVWTSRNPSIATVGEDGTVTAVSAGTAVISLRIGVIEKLVAVKVNPLPGIVILNKSQFIANGTTMNFKIQAVGAESIGTLTVKSVSNANVTATIVDTNTLRLVGAAVGEAEIVVANGELSEDKLTITVVDALAYSYFDNLTEGENSEFPMNIGTKINVKKTDSADGKVGIVANDSGKALQAKFNGGYPGVFFTIEGLPIGNQSNFYCQITITDVRNNLSELAFALENKTDDSTIGEGSTDSSHRTVLVENALHEFSGKFTSTKHSNAGNNLFYLMAAGDGYYTITIDNIIIY